MKDNKSKKYSVILATPLVSIIQRPIGGFLGLPGGKTEVKMTCVDIYSRVGEKLEENWVLLDLPYWLKQQGLDILERTNSILNFV